VSHKIRAMFIFMIISANADQFSIFSTLNSERICGGRRNYNYHLKSVATLPCEK